MVFQGAYFFLLLKIFAHFYGAGGTMFFSTNILPL